MLGSEIARHLLVGEWEAEETNQLFWSPHSVLLHVVRNITSSTLSIQYAAMWSHTGPNRLVKWEKIYAVRLQRRSFAASPGCSPRRMFPILKH
jgi:hypothetical protein